MPLTKNRMVSEIGRRTRLRNHDVQRMLEALIEVWTEELASGGRIELQNFLVLEVQRIDRGGNLGVLACEGRSYRAPRIIYRLAVRPSKRLRKNLQALRDHQY
jgi:hypothetical protein